MRCGWTFLDPSYDEAELTRLYAGTEGDSVTSVVIADRKRCEAVHKTVAPWLPAGRIRVLDVGGGAGELLLCFVDGGHEVTVVDMNDKPAGTSGIAKIRTPFLDWSGQEFDLIIMSHVLEHTASPSGFLDHARAMLAADGLLFVEVPFELLTPLIRRHIGDHRHLGYFSAVTLRGFLEKCGFGCLTIFLTAGKVGDSVIPVIRAVARKGHVRMPHPRWHPAPHMMLKSLITILNPLPWFLRGRNKFASLWR